MTTEYTDADRIELGDRIVDGCWCQQCTRFRFDNVTQIRFLDSYERRQMQTGEIWVASRTDAP